MSVRWNHWPKRVSGTYVRAIEWATSGLVVCTSTILTGERGAKMVEKIGSRTDAGIPGLEPVRAYVSYRTTYHARPMISEVLMPPKAKLLDIAYALLMVRPVPLI